MKRDDPTVISLKLLKLDMLSYNILLNEKWLKLVSLNISEKITLSDTYRRDEDFDINLWKTLKKQRLSYHVNDGIVSNNKNYGNDCIFNNNLGHKHYYSSALEYSRCEFKDDPKDGYIFYFGEIEYNLISIFSLHPTLESINRGYTIETDGSMMQYSLKYLRCYEKTLSLLSQHPFLYSHLIILLLIILLRNIRRLLHHFKSSALLIDLILLKLHSIYLTQKYLYKYCSKHFMNSDRSLDFNNLDEALLSSFNRYNEKIYKLCGEELNSSFKNLDELYFTIDEDDEDSMYNNQCSRDFNSTLCYDRADVLNINSDFNVKFDEVICKWMIDLCNYGSLYNCILSKPILINYSYIINLNIPNFIKTHLNLSLFRKKRSNIRRFIESDENSSTNVSQPKSNTNFSNKNQKHKGKKQLQRSIQIKHDKKMNYNSAKKQKKYKNYNRWDSVDEIKLLDSVNTHGYKWSYISGLYFSGKKTAPQLKDKWANLIRYGHVQLRKNCKNSSGIQQWSIVQK